MSVPSRLRMKAPTEFEYTARLLAVSVVKSCVDSKKGRYEGTVSEPVALIAWDIYNHVMIANGIYPTNQHEVQNRRDNFMLALSKLDNLAGAIGIAHEFYHFSDHDIDEMCGYIDKEKILLKKVLDSDKRRYKNLPGSPKPLDFVTETIKIFNQILMILQEILNTLKMKKESN